MTKRIALLTTVGDFEERRGPLNRLDMLISFFRGKGYKVSIISLSIYKPKDSNYADCELTWVPWDWIDVLKILFYLLRLNPISISVFQRRHLKLASDDIVCFHLVRAIQFPYLQRLPSESCLDFCENLSLNFYQRSHTLKRLSVKRYIMLLEAELLARFHKKLSLDKFKNVFVISEYEKKGINRSTTVISPQRITQKRGVRVKNSDKFRNLFFLGHIDYEPNLDALLKICELMATLNSEAIFHIVGRVNITNKTKLQKFEFVKIYGYVNAPEVIAEQCDLGIAYLYIGTGTQNKVFDYLRFGLPILVSETVNQGLDDETKQNVIVTSDILQFFQLRVA